MSISEKSTFDPDLEMSSKAPLAEIEELDVCRFTSPQKLGNKNSLIDRTRIEVNRSDKSTFSRLGELHNNIPTSRNGMSTESDMRHKAVKTAVDQTKSKRDTFFPRSTSSLNKSAIHEPLNQTTETASKFNRPVRKIVLNRSADRNFGFCFVGGADLSVGIFITSIIPGGAADFDGKLRQGDRILKVNEFDFANVEHRQAVEIIRNATEPTEFQVRHEPAEFETLRYDGSPSVQSVQQVNLSVNDPEENVYIRSEFSYCADSDQRVPGKGISFECGDILLVFNMGDQDWWKAVKICQVSTDKISEVGFIPSKKRAEKKFSNRKVNFNLQSIFMTEQSCKKNSFWDLKSKKKELSEDNLPQTPILSYHIVEHVSFNYSRPVFLMGAEYGKITEDLVKQEPEKYTMAVSCTSREPKENEKTGISYNFMSKQDMLEMLRGGQFVEIGIFKNNLYGITVNEINSKSLNPGVHCLLNMNPISIERLVSLGIHPIVIFVKLISVDNTSAIYRNCKRAEHIKIFNKIKKIEETNSKLFTAVVSGCNYMEIYDKVKETIQKFGGARHGWVPSNKKLS